MVPRERVKRERRVVAAGSAEDVLTAPMIAVVFGVRTRVARSAHGGKPRAEFLVG